MLTAENIKFSYDSQNTFEFPNFTCAAGEKKLILGSSGTGKTTFLHLLTGLLKPTSGRVCMHDICFSDLSNSALDKFRGKHLGLVFQTAHFINSLSVKENLEMPMALNKLKGSNSRISMLLDRLQIGHKANSKISNLSIGERQRVSIARSLIHKPDIIFADEPTSALDDKNTNYVVNLLEEQAEQEGAALVIVTHDNRLKDRYANRVEL